MVYINQNIEKHLIRDTVDFISIESGINLLKKLKRRIKWRARYGDNNT